jgi:hypothetical protein
VLFWNRASFTHMGQLEFFTHVNKNIKIKVVFELGYYENFLYSKKIFLFSENKKNNSYGSMNSFHYIIK